MRDLLEELARALVDDPKAVTVEQFEGDGGTIVLELCVGPDDYGRVIGRGGRTAHALRTVVKAGGGEGPPCARRHRRLSRGRAGCVRRPARGRPELAPGGSGARTGSTAAST